MKMQKIIFIHLFILTLFFIYPLDNVSLDSSTKEKLLGSIILCESNLEKVNIDWKNNFHEDMNNSFRKKFIILNNADYVKELEKMSEISFKIIYTEKRKEWVINELSTKYDYYIEQDKLIQAKKKKIDEQKQTVITPKTQVVKNKSTQKISNTGNTDFYFGLFFLIILFTAIFLLIKKTIRSINSKGRKRNRGDKIRSSITFNMKKLNGKKFKNISPVKEKDISNIRELLNNWSMKNPKVIKYFGSHIDFKSIYDDICIFGNFKYQIIERDVHDGHSADILYKKQSGSDDPYDMDYNLPNDFIDLSDDEQYIMLSTVESHKCPPTETCPSCHGSGKCKSCVGKGEKSCSRCGGEGRYICNTCNGDGKTSYTSGNSKILKICSTCRGSKYIHCNTCDGVGKVECRSCNGTGDCRQCSGSGEVVCSLCKGTGHYQTFKYFKNKYIYQSIDILFNYYDEINKILRTRDGNIIYDKTIIELKNQSELLIETKNDIMNIIPNKYFDNISDFLQNSKQYIDGKIAKIGGTLTSIPIKIIDYEYKNEPYKIYIIGNDEFIYCPKLPKIKFGERKNIFIKLRNLIKMTKIKLAYLYTASFIIWSDNKIAKEEKDLIKTFINSCNFSKKLKSSVLKLLDKKIEYADLEPYLKYVKKDKNIIIFAWHSIIVDKSIHKKEIRSFNKLVSYFKISDKELIELKKKAEGYMKINKESLVDAYLN